MNIPMYPFGPDDDFPQMFCAIRPCSGEQQFYTPEREHTNALLSRMHKEAMEMEEAIDSLTDRNQRLRVDNAKLRELMRVMAYCNQFRRDCDGCSMNDAAGIITERAGCDELLARLRELGVEAD